MRDHNFAFIDIETTGLNLLSHEIIEVGCVITTSELEIIEEFDLKIKPSHIETADPVALKVNHYNSEEWSDAHDLKDVMKILSEKTKDCIMVGQNVAFDSSFIELSFAKTEIPNQMHYHKFDTISIAWAKMHRDPTFEHFSLREMCLRFGIVNERAHSALSDARATYELYKKLLSL